MSSFGFKKKKLSSQRSFGQRLRIQRKRKKISLAQAEEETKIRVRYLDALEKGNFMDLPGEIYTLGFLKKYAQYLKMDVNSLVNQYKREKEILQKLGRTPAPFKEISPVKKVSGMKFFITPKIMAVAASVILILGFLGYIIFEVNQFAKPPILSIATPTSEGIVKTDKIIVSGTTDSGSELYINNNLIALKEDGSFSQEIKLAAGLNLIEVKAKNRLGKETDKSIKVLAEY